jgi:hypothetical protein
MGTAVRWQCVHRSSDGRAIVTPSEFAAHLRESCRRIGEATSRMTDEEYKEVQEEIELLQEALRTILGEVEG